MDEKKQFFARPTPAQIREGKEPLVLERRIIAGLEGLQPHQYAVIPETVFDARFWNPKFMKHGETIPLRRSSLFGKTPADLFKEAITHPQVRINRYLCGYSFRPLDGEDRVTRRVPLVELLEAARIMAYGTVYPGADVKVEGKYDDALKVRSEGGSYLVSTPSRRVKHPRHRFRVQGIVVLSSASLVYLIPYSFASRELGVESKAIRGLRYTKQDSPEPSRIDYIQAHEIAAAYAIAEAKLKEGNTTPLTFLPFPIVSQQAVDLYMILLNRTLLQVQDGEKVQQKHLTQAHIEPILGFLPQRKGYAAGFDDKALLEGRVRTYNWNNGIPTQAAC